MRVAFFLLCLSLQLFCKMLDVQVTAKSAILMNGETGAILFEKDAYNKAYPASTTKIATALFALEKGIDLNASVTVSGECLRGRPLKDREQYPPHWLDPDGTMMGLKRGEVVTYDSLLHGLMLVSGNDAANVIAETMAGSVPRFMEMLNEYLIGLGCRGTQFRNPHGLSHPEHFSTAYDLALIAKKALQFPKFRQVVSTLCYKKPKTNKQPETELRLTNPLLKPKSEHFYAKAIGVKTGYTAASQDTLVAAAEHQGRVLIAVILGCEKKGERYAEAKRLFEAAFAEEKEKRRLMGPETIFSQPLEGKVLKASPAKELTIEYFPAEEPKCKAALHWSRTELPVRKGEKVGEVVIRDEVGRELLKGDLLATETLKADLFHLLKQKILKFFH
jgi:D-alanyl-D-alanine carboxypeptidase (penicillin-binding protein 5/6)